MAQLQFDTELCLLFAGLLWPWLSLCHSSSNYSVSTYSLCVFFECGIWRLFVQCIIYSFKSYQHIHHQLYSPKPESSPYQHAATHKSHQGVRMMSQTIPGCGSLSQSNLQEKCQDVWARNGFQLVSEFLVQKFRFRYFCSYPIASMYGIFTYIYHKNQPNVGKYAIHGSYGYSQWCYAISQWFLYLSTVITGGNISGRGFTAHWDDHRRGFQKFRVGWTWCLQVILYTMGTHVSFIFRGYNPYIGGSRPSFFIYGCF